MRLAPGEPLRVTLAHAPNDEVVVGRLALDAGRAVFEYDEAFIASGMRLNPLWNAPSRALVRAQEPRAFKGLHGVFADSLPDAWGHALMRRRLAEQSVNYDDLTTLDRLALVGSTGVGALVYRPDYAEHPNGAIDLAAFAAGAIGLEGTPTEVVEELASLGGSSGGARPKVFVARNAAGDLVAGAGTVAAGYDPYIVKFRGSMDVADIGPLEAAYADMARAAGVEVAPTLLIPATKGHGYFATRRFDRGPNGTRISMLSVAAMIESQWDVPAIGYMKLIALVHGITRDHEAAEQMFRRMVFNVLAANADDHLKQHSFLQQRTGEWVLAPAYDLTLSSGPNGQRYLDVNGRGSEVTLDDIDAVARESSIRSSRAIVDEVRTAVDDFPKHARARGVTAATLAAFKRATETAGNTLMPKPPHARSSRRRT